MNVYLDTLESDIDRVRDMSSICRGGWCRLLESEADALCNELAEFRIQEGDFESARIEDLAVRIRDAYRHLAPAAVLWEVMR